MKLSLPDRVQLAQRLVSTIDEDSRQILKPCGLQRLSDDWTSFAA